jgi:hypothetical protein
VARNGDQYTGGFILRVGFSENNVFAAGTNGTILHYNGTAWISMNSGVDNHLMDMWGKSPDNLYAVGTQGVVIHFDGINWIKIYPIRKILYVVYGD